MIYKTSTFRQTPPPPPYKKKKKPPPDFLKYMYLKNFGPANRPLNWIDGLLAGLFHFSPRQIVKGTLFCITATYSLTWIIFTIKRGYDILTIAFGVDTFPMPSQGRKTRAFRGDSFRFWHLSMMQVSSSFALGFTSLSAAEFIEIDRIILVTNTIVNPSQQLKIPLIADFFSRSFSPQ